MNELIDHLANLTAHRERRKLDLSLTRALLDLLQPHSVGLYTPSTDAEGECWLEQVRLGPGEAVSVADPMGNLAPSLSRLNSAPLRLQCLQSRAIASSLPDSPGADHVTVFPLIHDAQAEGVIEIRSSQALAPAECRMVHGMQQVYSNMLRMLDYSELDSLTGLLNRKSFDEVFFQALPPAAGGRRSGEAGADGTPSWWLGMVDIDHFKQVNDRFGHLIGDEVLLLVAGIMRDSFRLQDRLYRFGGEEFVVLVRANSETDAMHAFERLRRNMAAYDFPQAGRITISIGMTNLLSGDSPSSAIDRADQSVYFAKNSGRNRVCNYADLVRSGAMDEEHKQGEVELF